MKLSPRALSIPESGTFIVKRMAEALRAKGHDVIDLGPGEPDFPTFPEIVAAGKRALDEGYTKYAPVAGLKELRDALAAKYNARYGLNLTAENFFVSAGGKGALYHLFLALAGAGDEVIIPAPFWVSYPEQVKLADAAPVIVSTEAAGGVLAAAHIERALTGKTRAFVVNSPSNPSGRVIPKENLRALVKLAKARNVVLVADECYEAYDYEGAFASVMEFYAEAPENIVLAHTFSKSYAMTGWRIGFAAGNKELLTAMSNLHSHTMSGTATMVQKAGVEALASGEATFKRTVLAEYKKRRDLAVEALGKMPGVEVVKPEGAFYVFPSVRGAMEKLGAKTTHDFCKRLLEEAFVAVVPGGEFGAEGYIRISYAVSEARLKEAFARMEKFLRG